MSKKLRKTSPDKAHAEILQHFLPIQLLPDEDPETHGALRDAILLDLKPGTPYEHILAEQLVILEWESLRHRRMRDNLIMAEFRRQSIGVFEERKDGWIIELFPEPNQSAIDMAFNLVSTNTDRRAEAMQALEKAQITPSEIVAMAYSAVAKDLQPHERHIAELEVRRRKLREDFDRLKTARARPVEEAELVVEQ
ncbi:MAG: hypothetical protein AAED33_00220 [Paracoccaceae bacterium]